MTGHAEDHHHATLFEADAGQLRILAIDVGAGTQDVLVYDSARAPENCVKLVVPSQTQIVGARVRAVTRQGLPLHLAGALMGGGASTDAIKAHLTAGLAVTATGIGRPDDPQRPRSCPQARR